MKNMKDWVEEETNEWVLQFEAKKSELMIIRKIEAENGMNFSGIISSWLRWVIQNPEEAREQLKKWMEVKP